MSMLKQIKEWQDQARTLEESEKRMAILNQAINVPATSSIGGYANNGLYNAYPAIAQADVRKEIGVHELTIRSMENGYIVTANEGGPGYAAKHYVAKDVDDLCETIKLALVNRKLDAIK